MIKFMSLIVAVIALIISLYVKKKIDDIRIEVHKKIDQFELNLNQIKESKMIFKGINYGVIYQSGIN
ncbi:MAG: hypothetical protein ACE5KT_07215, partial [Methanosarcinales archaeon]